MNNGLSVIGVLFNDSESLPNHPVATTVDVEVSIVETDITALHAIGDYTGTITVTTSN